MIFNNFFPFMNSLRFVLVRSAGEAYREVVDNKFSRKFFFFACHIYKCFKSGEKSEIFCLCVSFCPDFDTQDYSRKESSRKYTFLKRRTD